MTQISQCQHIFSISVEKKWSPIYHIKTWLQLSLLVMMLVTKSTNVDYFK